MSSWVEKEPGVYTTDYGGAEKIFRKISTLFAPLKREHFGISCVLTLSWGSSIAFDKASALREAWKTIRVEYPGMGVIPDGLFKKTYRSLDGAGVEDWSRQTFIIDEERSADAITSTMEPRDLPVLFYLPKKEQLVLLTSHWRIDAMGMCMVLDRLLSLIGSHVSPDATSGASDLDSISPCLEDAAGSPGNFSPQHEAFGKGVIENFHKNAVSKGGMRYRGDATTPSGDPTSFSTVISNESSKLLVKACKELGISVTAAVHAALAQVVFSLASPENAEEDYCGAMAVNLRDKLRPPYNTKQHAVQTYVISIATRVKRDSSFNESAKALTHEYKNWCSDMFLESLRPIYAAHAEALFNPKRPVIGVPPTPPSGITLSSLGVIENNLCREYANGALEVKDFQFGVGMMTRQMLMYVWTFCGRLHMRICYNQAYYGSEVPQDILERLLAVLATELKVKLSTDA